MSTLQAYEDPGANAWALNFGSLAASKLIPIFVDFLRELAPKLLVYCSSEVVPLPKGWATHGPVAPWA